MEYLKEETYGMSYRIENAIEQHWWISGITEQIYIIQSEYNPLHWLHSETVNGEKVMTLKKEKSAWYEDFGDPDKHLTMWFRLH